MTSIFYVILFGVVLFIMLFVFMYLSYKHFVRKIEAQRRENIQSVLVVQERERRIIALEVHDNLGPLLSITNMQVESLMIDEVNEHKKEEIQEVYKQIKYAVAICRDISHELTPFLNEETSLVQMIHEYLQKVNATGKIKAHFHCNIGDLVIVQQKAASISRMILELLTNTIKHAEAENATIDISVKGSQLILTYTDDGKGISEKSNTGIGLKNIESRVLLLNGVLQIGEQHTKGIKIIVKIPVREFSKS